MLPRIAKYLDLRALVAISRVSKSWNTLFGKNSLMIFKQKEKIQDQIIIQDQVRRMLDKSKFIFPKHNGEPRR